MSSKNNFYEQLLLKLSHIFDEIYTSGKNTASLKPDQSPVTLVDHAFSDAIEDYFASFIDYKRFHFYSEEKHQELEFPAIIVDPIDGTRELALGVPECAVSIAIMHNSEIENPKNSAWIYNPFTSEVLEAETLKRNVPKKENLLLGYVSNTEWKNNLYLKYEREVTLELKPLGSIAYKLLKLANYECDFVVTMRPKNIWDIAGGSILLAKKDIGLYGPHGKIYELDTKTISSPLLWCSEQNYKRLKDIFFI